jgi:hypothetical protein
MVFPIFPLLRRKFSQKQLITYTANMQFGIDCDQAMLQPKQDQIRVALDMERLHYLTLMEFHSLFAQGEDRSNLFYRPAFSQQLHNLALSFGQVP